MTKNSDGRQVDMGASGDLLLLQFMPNSQVGQDFNRSVRIPSRLVPETNAEGEHTGDQTGYEWSSAICIYPDIYESELVSQVLEYGLDDEQTFDPSAHAADISADCSETQEKDFLYALEMSLMDRESSSPLEPRSTIESEVDTATRSPLSSGVLPAEERPETESLEDDLHFL